MRINGFALMVLALFCFATMEVFVKLLASEVSTVLILWFRNMVQLVLVLVICLPRLGAVARTKYPKLQFARAALILSATSAFVYGLQKNALVEANAIAQTAPIWITLGAALFLGERVGWHRGLSVVAGLLGALIVLRPGTPDFSPWLLFPMIGALLISGYSLVTRFVGRDEDVWTSLLYTALFATGMVSLLLPLSWTPLGPEQIGMLLCVGVLGSVAQLFLTLSFARVEASALAPLSYVSLVFSGFWGVVIFDHYPDAATYLGALVIVGAGLYVWRREMVMKKT